MKNILDNEDNNELTELGLILPELINLKANSSMKWTISSTKYQNSSFPEPSFAINEVVDVFP